MDSFLVLAGPVNDPPDGYEIQKGDYTVMSWSRTAITGRFDLEGYGEKVKPETILPLEEKVGNRVLLSSSTVRMKGGQRPLRSICDRIVLNRLPSIADDWTRQEIPSGLVPKYAKTTKACASWMRKNYHIC